MKPYLVQRVEYRGGERVPAEGARGNWKAYRTGRARGMLCRGCNVIAGVLERGNATASPRASMVRAYLARSGNG